MAVPAAPTENRLLLELWSDDRSLLWPLDRGAPEFAFSRRKTEPGAVVNLVEAGRAVGTAISVGGGPPSLHLLTERFSLARLAYVAESEDALFLRAEARKRFDPRLVRAPLYRLLVGEGGAAPVEARIRPAAQVGADWSNGTIYRVALGSPVNAGMLLICRPGDPPPRFETLLSFAAVRRGETPDITIERLPDQALTGDATVLEVRSSRRRIAAPAALIAALDDAPAEGRVDAEWWGRNVTTLAFAAQRYGAHRGGILELVASTPWSARQQRAARAIRLFLRLLRLEERDASRVIDHCYRRQETVDALRTLHTYASRSGRAAIRAGVGERRLQRFLAPFAPFSVRGTPSLGDRVADAAFLLADTLSDRARRPGDALPAEVDRVVRDEFIEPRGRASFTAFKKEIADGSLPAALEAASLSRLRRHLRAFPRRVLVDAAVGDSPAVRKRISAIYSRRGRRLFYEDLEVREAEIYRDNAFDYGEVLDARGRVRALARRLAL